MLKTKPAAPGTGELGFLSPLQPLPRLPKRSCNSLALAPGWVSSGSFAGSQARPTGRCGDKALAEGLGILSAPWAHNQTSEGTASSRHHSPEAFHTECTSLAEPSRDSSSIQRGDKEFKGPLGNKQHRSSQLIK